MNTNRFSRAGRGLVNVLLALFLIGGAVYSTVADAQQRPGIRARLVIDPTTLDYGSAAVGSMGAAFIFAVRNTGRIPSSPISVSLAGNQPADFVLGANNCAGKRLAFRASCTIEVSFKPTAGGARAATLGASAIRGGIATANLSGTGTTAGPTLSIDPASHEFGPVFAGGLSGHFDAKRFDVSNTGTATTSPLSVSLDGANASDFVLIERCAGVSLAPGGFCDIEVFFFPSTVGPLTATLHASATQGGAVSASLSGTGVTPPAFFITVTPGGGENFESSPVGSTTQTVFIEITNNDVAPQATFVTIEGANPDDFLLDPASCSEGSLDPGQSCHIFVAFRPTTVGLRTADIVVSGEAGESSVTLTGTGTAP